VSERRSTDDGPDESDPGAFDEGRYLYCVVDATGQADASVSVSGVDNETPYLLERDGIGAVVHACTDAYESTDVDTVRGWLLCHQKVVDEAGERFGTPLPFRFDTILKGNDDRVREWLVEESETLGDALDRFADQWEYRIEVVRDRDVLDDHLASADEDLAELRERRREASEGTEFLLAKQYERELRELRERHLHAETAELVDRLADVASEVQEADRSASLLDESDRGSESEERSSLTVLAPADREGDVGDILDEYAARPGVEIRFTGPWPPYSFAPELGGDG